MSDQFKTFLEKKFNIWVHIVGIILYNGRRIDPKPTRRDHSRCDNQAERYPAAFSRKKGDQPATRTELTSYGFFVPKLLYLGRLASPVVKFHAFHAATKCADLHLSHLRALHASLKTINDFSAASTYLSSSKVHSCWRKCLKIR